MDGRGFADGRNVQAVARSGLQPCCHHTDGARVAFFGRESRERKQRRYYTHVLVVVAGDPQPRHRLTNTEKSRRYCANVADADEWTCMLGYI